MKRIFVSLLSFCLVITALGFPVSAKSEKIKPRRVQISTNKTTVRVNQERNLLVEVLPVDTTDKEVNWSSSNEEVVSVDEEGRLVGISPGVAEIEAVAHNGISDSCTVTVPAYPLKDLEEVTNYESHPDAYTSNGEILSAASIRLDVQDAVKEGKSDITYVNKMYSTSTALGSAAFTAAYNEGSVKLKFVTTNNITDQDFPKNIKDIQGQITVDPDRVDLAYQEIGLGVYTTDPQIKKLQKQLEKSTKEDLAVVYLTQQGSFEMPVKIGAQLDLSKLNTDKLKFYSYDSKTNKLTLLPDQNYSIDKNGFLHFIARQGGTVVVKNA